MRDSAPPAVHATAGALAGLIATASLYPLDLVKARFQANDGGRVLQGIDRYRSTTDAFRTIVRKDGIRGLYAGLSPNMLGAGVAWGAYFLTYQSLKELMRVHLMGEEPGSQAQLPSTLHLVAAAQSGTLTALMTNPIWVVKTRMQLQQPGSAEAYTGMVDAWRNIMASEGPRALYKGIVPSLWGVSHGALMFMFYERVTRFFKNRRREEQAASGADADGASYVRLSDLECIAAAAISKTAATVISYPPQVVRTRLQQQRTPTAFGSSATAAAVARAGTAGAVTQSTSSAVTATAAADAAATAATAAAAAAEAMPPSASRYEGFMGTIRTIVKYEGIGGLYKGLPQSLIRVVPASCITFYCYENIVDILEKIRELDQR